MADDKRLLGANLATVGRFGGAGLLGGSSAAAALVLVRMLKDLDRDRRALHEPSEEEEHTITLTLPKTAAEKSGTPRVRKTVSRSKEMAATTPSQLRKTDGRFGDNVKKANWQTLAASLLAMGAGGGLGFELVNKMYEKRRQNQLHARLEAAKQEYMDTLGKTAMDKSALPFMGGTRKGDPSFSLMDYPLGIGALALLLGSGSTAWLTKRILDEYNKEPESKFDPRKLPHIERIVFQSSPGGHTELPSMDRAKTAAAQDGVPQECFEAMLGIYLDVMSGRSDVLGDEKCAEAAPLGITPSGLYKMATEDYDRLMMYLKANPELRSVIKHVAMQKHPLLKHLKWTADLPLVSSYTDARLYDTLARNYGPNSDIWDAARQHTLGKTAGVADMVGSTVAGSSSALAMNLVFNKALERKNRAAAGSMESPEDRAARIEEMAQSIQLGAKDPAAMKFVSRNSEKIRNILLMLAEEGKI
jgi:hypothetical protein